MKISDIRQTRSGYEDPTHVEKISLKLPEGVIPESAPGGKTVSNLLAGGEIDGVIRPRTPSCSDRGYPQVEYLFGGPQKSMAEQYERHELSPIMHTLGIRKTLTKQHSWLSGVMVKMFECSKKVVLVRLNNTPAIKVTLPSIEGQPHDARRLVGHDFWSYGFTDDEHVINRFLTRHHTEGLPSRRLQSVELFHPTNLEGLKI